MAVFQGNIIRIGDESWTVIGFTMTHYKVYSGRLDVTKLIPRQKVNRLEKGVYQYIEN